MDLEERGGAKASGRWDEDDAAAAEATTSKVKRRKRLEDMMKSVLCYAIAFVCGLVLGASRHGRNEEDIGYLFRVKKLVDATDWLEVRGIQNKLI